MKICYRQVRDEPTDRIAVKALVTLGARGREKIRHRASTLPCFPASSKKIRKGGGDMGRRRSGPTINNF